MNNKCLSFTLALYLGSITSVYAQRGLPPREKTKSVSITNYAQALDFLPEMVNLLKVPEGWEVKIAASGLGKPRMLYNGPNGSIYITRRDAGDVLMLKDPDMDGKFADLVTVLSDFKGVHGITMKDNWLYLANNHEVRRYPVNTDGRLGAMQLLINDLPDGGQHPNRTIGFGPDGMLYISVGSECNDCKESDKELATMLQVDPKTWKRTIFASGLRNTIGFDFHPQTGELWGIDNGGDAKGSNWPPEEVNHITKGGHYGWPYAYGKREVDQSREDPAGEIKEEVVKNTMPSVLELTAHMAPIAFTFFGNAGNIPSAYAGDGLVAWHGSWNAKKPVGFKVQRIKFENGQAVGTEDFLTGFLKGNARFGRPAGIVVNPKGIVYVSDDANGVIYAIKRKN
ncbi:PQQ-dependent sugar dehydrogenase [Hufsiella ginkgonis]|uniref:Glucose dehydrogenase n=1 Tax=Hufsiella ginkgonis TaxID=2695274 RepID=A0A7K1Y073_9SPHI|nr:PQQ-dependent sugar dehydrogenase [Hufsiella ginkgonis]MXV16671.1 glucose dehydrogenase [Hufsiella ginkgonis]